MKVLSLQEPYATFILKGYKKIETRSWGTAYRGDLLIHASLSKAFLKSITNPKVLRLLEKVDLNYGYIICKATLTDCQRMTKEFIEEIKMSPEEYNLGIYEEGRYAWFLTNIEPITPIPAKGHLGLWEYKK